MESQTMKVAESSETLTSAMDVINIHPDKQDVMNVDNEIDEATEDNLLNQGETQPPRAPRPLFMGPTKKNRRARGARKNTRNSDDNKMDNAASKSTPVNKETEPNNTAKINLNWNNKAANETVAQLTGKHINNNTPKTPKRMRSAQTSPNVSSDAGVTNKPKKQRTFAEAIANDLKLQISNKNGIDTEQLINIENGLMKELDKHLTMIPTPVSIPTYHTSSFQNGVLKLICADNFSAEWIKNAIRNMPTPWEGANLEVSVWKPPQQHTKANPMAQIGQGRPQRRTTPRRPTIRFFIPSGIKKPSFEEVSKRLQLQNQPLNTGNWIAWKAEEKADGTFYHVSVDHPNVEFIKAKNGRLFYCFSKIKINLPKEPKGDGSKQETTMEGVKTEGTE